MARSLSLSSALAYRFNEPEVPAVELRLGVGCPTGVVEAGVDEKRKEYSSSWWRRPSVRWQYLDDKARRQADDA